MWIRFDVDPHSTRNVFVMSEWTGTRTQPPRIEIEAMLRLLFADHGTRDDVLNR